ncbi:MAG: hypothetical protein H6Q99_2744, partial [Proteobacteria bacterium]|nr:hypothetical protein [Pseudomonadota bacterium]
TVVTVGAEGATAPETLRQTDRSQRTTLWKAGEVLGLDSPKE